MNARALRDIAPQVGRGATSEAEMLGHSVRELDLLLPGLVSNALGAASRSSNPTAQMTYLEHTRTVLESVEQLVTAAQQASGNLGVSLYLQLSYTRGSAFLNWYYSRVARMMLLVLQSMMASMLKCLLARNSFQPLKGFHRNKAS